MIKHIVMLDLPDGYDRMELADIMSGLDQIRGVIAGFMCFAHGENRDFEGMSQDRNYGFICSFADEAASLTYLANAAHQALGKRLVGLCNGGAAGITVIDLAIAA